MFHPTRIVLHRLALPQPPDTGHELRIVACGRLDNAEVVCGVIWGPAILTALGFKLYTSLHGKRGEVLPGIELQSRLTFCLVSALCELCNKTEANIRECVCD